MRVFTFFVVWVLAASLTIIGRHASATPSPLLVEVSGQPAPLANSERPAWLDDELVYELPRVDDVQLDGDLEEWAGKGLVLDVLHPLPSETWSPEFDSRARLGWNEDALFVAWEVTDLTPGEDPNMPIWSGDSVELFAADRRGGRNFIQYLVGPGLTERQTELRSELVDRRDDRSLRTNGAVAQFARGRTANGYTVEGRIPWAMLGKRAEKGAEFALQLYVRDQLAPFDTRSLAWHAHPATYLSSHRMQRVQLVDTEPTPMTVAAQGRVIGCNRSLELEVLTTQDVEGLTVMRDSGETLVPLFSQRGRLASALLRLPAPSIEQPLVSVSVARNERLVDRILFTAQGELEPSLQKLEVRADRNVFTGSTFPALRFADKKLAHALLGTTRLEVRYFDDKFRQVTHATSPGRYGAVAEVFSNGQRCLRREVTLYRLPKGVTTGTVLARPLPPRTGLEPDDKPLAPAPAPVVHTRATPSAALSEATAKLLGYVNEAPEQRSKMLRHEWASNEAYWHEQRRRAGNVKLLNYLIHLPEGAQDAPTSRWPTILFLHGSGERGHELNLLEEFGPYAYAKRAGPDFPFIVIAPQCPDGERWNPFDLEDLYHHLLANHPIDPDRIYLTGLSMGAVGTWSLSALHPEWFAAAAPICGATNLEHASELADLPLWIFHGDKDSIVPAHRSREMASALRKLGGRVRFTLYPDTDHDAWTETYAAPELYDWFLQQTRRHPHQPRGVPSYCGDRILNDGEACDDGNLESSDGCDANCSTTEAEPSCDVWGASCDTVDRCGDGLTNADEQCDDGNDIVNDGCTACFIEPGNKCTGQPSVCTNTVCGDDRVEGTEACDDGNTLSFDGCSARCEKEPLCDDASYLCSSDEALFISSNEWLAPDL